MRRERERCEHCKKWIPECHGFTLEGKVSDGVDINFAICEKCSRKNHASGYWNEWVKKQEAIPQCVNPIA